MIEIDKVKLDTTILTKKEQFTLHVASIIKGGKVCKMSFEVS